MGLTCLGSPKAALKVSAGLFFIRNWRSSSKLSQVVAIIQYVDSVGLRPLAQRGPPFLQAINDTASRLASLLLLPVSHF